MKEPKTFRERVAFALAAHDLQGGEGYLNDGELAALDRILMRIASLYGSDKALADWLAVRPIDAAPRMMRPLQRLCALEKERRRTEGKAIMHARFTAMFWQDYLGAADAAIGVLGERPEAVKAMLAEEEEA